MAKDRTEGRTDIEPAEWQHIATVRAIARPASHAAQYDWPVDSLVGGTVRVMTTARNDRHQRLSALLASCGDIELAAIVATGRPSRRVWAAVRQWCLRDRELPNMDGHFGNMRPTGERIYLSDVGLVTSPPFELWTAERGFAETPRHR